MQGGDYMKTPFELGKSILQRLRAEGHEAFFVGGFVRDRLLGFSTDDIDIATSALSEDVEAIFERVVPTGIRYGTVTVLMEHASFEVTTYRTESGYYDRRRPDQVTFTRSLEEDLKRRDFTINQLVMDDKENVLDHFGGLDDLKTKTIRTIGDPKERFEEDALRLLRAFRFVAKLGFTIENNTSEAIKSHRNTINDVAVERILDEFDKILHAPYRKHAFEAICETQFHETFFGLSKGIEILAKSTTKYSPLAAYTLLFYYQPKLFDTFKFSKRTEKTVKTIYAVSKRLKDDGVSERLVFDEGKEQLLHADDFLKLIDFPSHEKAIRAIAASLPIHTINALAFNGDDCLNTLPIKRNADIGIILNQLVEDVITGKVSNQYETLKARAYEINDSLQGVRKGEKS